MNLLAELLADCLPLWKQSRQRWCEPASVTDFAAFPAARGFCRLHIVVYPFCMLHLQALWRYVEAAAALAREAENGSIKHLI